MKDMVDGFSNGVWWWAGASSAQLAAGIASYRRGCGRESLMPFKAFAVASLFVGAGASALAGILHASGIRTVDDLKEVGASIRRKLEIPPGEESK